MTKSEQKLQSGRRAQSTSGSNSRNTSLSVALEMSYSDRKLDF